MRVKKLRAMMSPYMYVEAAVQLKSLALNRSACAFPALVLRHVHRVVFLVPRMNKRMERSKKTKMRM
jgi:hypothetical protein